MAWSGTQNSVARAGCLFTVLFLPLFAYDRKRKRSPCLLLITLFGLTVVTGCNNIRVPYDGTGSSYPVLISARSNAGEVHQATVTVTSTN